MNHYSFIIYNTTASLPLDWDDVAYDNAFLRKSYLKVLEEASAKNMSCFYIGIFEDKKLIGVALSQYLDLNQLSSFGERDRCLKTMIRNLVFKYAASHVLFLGNNMITGQNGFAFTKAITNKEIGQILKDCASELITYFKKRDITIHLVSFKDFYAEAARPLKETTFKFLYEFNTQPNMIFKLKPHWKSMQDYVNDLSKKYRDQYKRAQKKANSVICRELTYKEAQYWEKDMYRMYAYVAKNAAFNTFFLQENHFSVFRNYCNDGFKIFGYFDQEHLIGFHTLLLNGETLETYFLGYDEKAQKEKMLYLNMLYQMTAFGIENGFKRIIFGRTALEIKSSVGAEPVQMSGFIYHTQPLINRFIDSIFKKLEPVVQWQQRHPFK